MKIVFKKYWWFGCLILVIGIIVASISYKESSRYVINNYIRAINGKDYEKAYGLLHKEGIINDRNKEAIVGYMEDYFKKTQLIKMKKVTKQPQEPGHYYSVRYLFRTQQLEGRLSVVKNEGGFGVVFPFKLSDVTVHAPLGSTVLLDGKPMVEKEDGVYYVATVLPGAHKITVQFANEGYKVYEQHIRLPKNQEVSIPCERVSVKMDVPAARIIQFSGKERVSTGEEMVFGQVLPGTYIVKVVDPNGVFEMQEQVFTIGETASTLVFEPSTLSKEGTQRMRKYIEKFYADYEEGIEKQETSFWEKYLAPEATQVVALYKEWFIENKEVVDTKMTYEIKEIKPMRDDLIEVQLVEMVELLNKEVEEERAYRILLKSQIILQPVGKNYLIQSKTIEESMVSYKDAEGKWIAY